MDLTMRIAYLCADRGVPLAGTKGASIHVRGVAEALRGRGHDVEVIAVREREGRADVDVDCVPVRFDPVLKELRESISGDSGPTLGGETHGLLTNSLCLEALESVHCSLPVDAVYERYSLWSIAGLQFARRHGIPFVVEVNAPLIDEQQRYRDLALGSLARQIERLVLSRADAIFVPSRELAHYINGRVKPHPRVIVVPNGADIELFDPERPSGIDTVGRRGREIGSFSLENKYVIAFVSSLKAWHGVPELLAAFEQVLASECRAHLLVLGGGPLLPMVRDAARGFGEQELTVTGPVSHDEVAAWLRRADVGVAPYPELDDFYFSPLKVIEYLAAGLPVVASRLGQLGELVEPGKTGLLVEPGNPAELANALLELGRDARLRRQMGRRARRRAVRRHGWDRVAAKIEKTLERLQAKCQKRDAEPVVAGAEQY